MYISLADDPFDEAQTAPMGRAWPSYAASDATFTLLPRDTCAVAAWPIQDYEELAGIGETIWGGVQKIGGWVYGGVQAAANLGRAVGGFIGGERASGFQAAMSKAQTVADQLLVVQAAMKELETARGRPLTPQERAALEQQIFGPSGAPIRLSPDMPAVGPPGVPWVPILAAGLGLLLVLQLTRR